MTVAAAVSLSVSDPQMAAPTLQLQDNDFKLLGLPERFGIDTALLDERWKQLQREVHPDRFASQGAAAQRVAMQWSVRVNEAYNRLKNPLTRAAYWCELRGVPVKAESNTAMPAAFLMQQMEWRETLEDASTEDALLALLDDTRAARRQMLEELARTIDLESNAALAVGQVRALMFVERFADDVHNRLDRFA